MYALRRGDALVVKHAHVRYNRGKDVAEKPPVTIRIARPYGSEMEFVDGDFASLGRTTIVLPNGPVRQAGELIRFEVVLTNGSPVFRGEGHVVSHNAPGSSKPPGLEVRFTRIDARSKAILDHVRERRAAAARGPDAAALSQAPGPQLSQAPIRNLSQAPARNLSQAPARNLSQAPKRNMSQATARNLSQTPARNMSQAPAMNSSQAPVKQERERTVRYTTQPTKVAAPPNRDEILGRLRLRAERLSAAGGLSFKKKQAAKPTDVATLPSHHGLAEQDSPPAAGQEDTREGRIS
jgi:hypothetical protein